MRLITVISIIGVIRMIRVLLDYNHDPGYNHGHKCVGESG